MLLTKLIFLLSENRRTEGIDKVENLLPLVLTKNTPL